MNEWLEMVGKIRIPAEELAYLGTSIRRELANEIRAYCVVHAKTLREVLEEALEEYLRKAEKTQKMVRRR